MREGRWETVTESHFNHERSGLDRLRAALPDAEPWRAWSNFTFTSSQGLPREVDALVIAPNGLHLLELKDWHGQVRGAGSSWEQDTGGGRLKFHHNPLHLANQKARELRSLLQQVLPRGVEVPWITASVVFTSTDLGIGLPPNDQAGLYFLGGECVALPEILDRLKEPPRGERDRVDMTRSKALAKALKGGVGVRRSDAEYQVGPWKLDRAPIDVGPTWADYIGKHTSIAELRRVRIYYRERNADRGLSESVDRAARREAQVLQGVRHPGIVPVAEFDPSGHSAGPSLLYPYDARTKRLDQYLLEYGSKLDLKARVQLIRQLAETVAYAHRRRLYHRALSAHVIHVLPGPLRAGVDPDGPSGADEAWLRPRLMIADWQVAVRKAGGTRTTSTADSTRVDQHLDVESAAYSAPELTAVHPDPVSMDVFGLGALAYLLITGKAPAANRAELTARLESERMGLVPSGVADGLTSDMDDLVSWATAFEADRRVATVEEFLELLATVEEEFAEAPTESDHAGVDKPAEQIDALEARPEDVLADRWLIKRRLGAGATSVAFLAVDLQAPDPKPGQPDRRDVVLKVSRSDDRAPLLHREAEVLNRLGGDSRVIKLRIETPIPLGDPSRTTLILDFAGKDTVARQLREEGRLSVDELDKYADYLFGAVDYLEGQGVVHRDLKPDNIAIHVRPNRTKQLVLFDFSLGDHSPDDIEAGTPGYLDPFLGTNKRPRYDAAAEYYALAVTLHEMASRSLPVWGEDKVAARQTDPAKELYPRLAVEAFDPAVREGLDHFFRRALHRDADQRFKTLAEMRDAWKLVFLHSDHREPVGARPSRHTPDSSKSKSAKTADVDSPGSVGVVGQAEPTDIQEIRDRAAKKATRDTPLDAAGLSPRVVSVAQDFGAATVGDLLDLSRKALINQPGLGAKTRQELQQRIKQWRKAFHDLGASPLDAEAREEASQVERDLDDRLAREGAEATDEALRRLSLDTLATFLVPDPGTRKNSRNTSEVTRLWLGLPDEHNVLPVFDRFPATQKAVGDVVGLTPGGVNQIVAKQRDRWAEVPALRVLRDQVVELLQEQGRVAGLDEIASALLVRRGSSQFADDVRMALARATALAAVELGENAPEERLLSTRRHRDGRQIIAALEVREDVDDPQTPQSGALLELADDLGKAADRLAERDTLPSSATTLTELREIVGKKPNIFPGLDERRLVHLAATASHMAAASSRLEIYAKTLPLVRALRITQAGIVRWEFGQPDEEQPYLRVSDIRERVLGRFPDLAAPIDRPALDGDLKAAGFELKWSRDKRSRDRGYIADVPDSKSSFTTLSGPAGSWRGTRSRVLSDPKLQYAAQANERLESAAQRPGFKVLTVGTSAYPRARRELESRLSTQSVSLAALFLAALKGLITPGTRPTWSTILNADTAEPGSRAATKLGEYTAAAWRAVEPKLEELLTASDSEDSGPILLYDAGLLTRYGALSVLQRLAEKARRGGGRPLWVLCPSDSPQDGPKLDGVLVQTAMDNEWVVLTKEWVRWNDHRGGARPVADRDVDEGVRA